MRYFPFALVIAALTMMLGIAALSSADIASTEEARAALVVQQMRSEGNYVLPWRSGEEMPSTPPMYHWLAAFGSSVATDSEAWALRLPSVLSAAIALSLLGWFAVAHRGLKVAVLSVVLTGSSMLWWSAASEAGVAMSFACFFSLSVYLLYLLSHGRQRYYWSLVVGTGVVLAATALVVGLMGMCSAMLVAILLTLLRAIRLKEFKSIPVRAFTECFLIALVLASSWYVMAYAMHGEAFLYRQIWAEYSIGLRERGVQAFVGQHSWFASALQWFLGYQPWALLLPLFFVWLWQNRAEALRNDDIIACILWVAIMLLASIVTLSTKAAYWVAMLPAVSYLLAVSLLDARWLAENVQKVKRYYAILLYGVSVVFLVSALSAAVLWVLPERFSQWVLPALDEFTARSLLLYTITNSYTAAGLLLAVSAALWFFARSFLKDRAFIGATCLGVTVLALVVYLQHHLQKIEATRVAPREFVAQLEQHLEPDDALYQFKTAYYPVVYHLQRSVETLEPSSRELSDGAGVLLVSEKDRAEANLLLPKARELFGSQKAAANGEGRLYALRFTNAITLVAPNITETTTASDAQVDDHQPDPSQPNPTAPVEPLPETQTVPVKRENK